MNVFVVEQNVDVLMAVLANPKKLPPEFIGTVPVVPGGTESVIVMVRVFRPVSNPVMVRMFATSAPCTCAAVKAPPREALAFMPGAVRVTAPPPPPPPPPPPAGATLLMLNVAVLGVPSVALPVGLLKERFTVSVPSVVLSEFRVI